MAFPNRWKDLTGEGGFDAVVGNPPYVRQEKIKPIKPALEARYPAVHDGVADLYVYFFARALQSLRPGGRFAYVVNNKWLKADYAGNLRALLADADRAWLIAITDFGHAKAFFPGVDAFPSVVCVQKPDAGAPPETAQVAAIPRDLLTPEALTRQVAALRFPLPRAAFSRSAWVLEPPPVLALMAKLREGGVPLKD
ncbi:MAG: Eco57I restriction-modification methylase domain-containing protein, partial [Roseococcus sp.]|nr:Eco57I restriction-modification methylase domain-containing protein [Roseococcus sp.]